MTNYQKLENYYKENFNLNEDNNEYKFFLGLSKLFGVSIQTAMDIWYAESRSWFKPEMIDELIRLDAPENEGHRPNLYAGDFDWRDGKFYQSID
jgi:hypothetical protein